MELGQRMLAEELAGIEVQGKDNRELQVRVKKLLWKWVVAQFKETIIRGEGEEETLFDEKENFQSTLKKPKWQGRWTDSE